MDTLHLRRDVLEFIIGPPDRPSSAVDPALTSHTLSWQCGCVAVKPEPGEDYGVRPCAEHRSEFEEPGPTL
ncbi:MAG: hypothetical protein NVSMB5_19230 [Candidatus Velthaea sp.]